MKVKYVRWSTPQQTGARQLIDSKDYDLIMQEQITGSIKFIDRPKGKELLNLINAGKVKELHVEEITRLGRDAHDTVNTLAICEDSGVNVVVINMGLHSIVDGKPNSIFKIVTYLLSAVAQQEKDGIKERTEAGKVAARARGVVFGRKSGSNECIKDFLNKDDNKKAVKLLKEGRNSIREIAAIAGLSPATVQKVKNAIT